MGNFKNNWNSEMLFEDYDVDTHDQGVSGLAPDAQDALNKLQRKEKKRSKYKKRKVCWQ